MNGTPASAVTTCPPVLSGRSWRRRTALLLIGVLTLNACYSTRPIAGVPARETRLVLDLNDQGRSAYGERIGSSVREVEGIVESATDSVYELRISAVRYLDGSGNKWAGERFRFRTDHVSRIRQREFSRPRTAGVVVLTIVAVAALVATVSLIGSASSGTRGGPGDGNGSQ